MSYGLDRHRLAKHEAGHAVASWLLGRVVMMVSLDYPPVGGGASIDKMPYEALGAARRPLAAWYEVESDCLVILAGPLCEDLDHDDEPVMSTTPQRVPLPVAYQTDFDTEPEWPELLGSDLDQLQRLTAGISSSEREREALEEMLRYRTLAMANTPHFKALHRRLTDVLEQRGELYASDVKHELERAEVRFMAAATTTTLEDNTDGPEAA
jgi:hypothetical protein